MENDLRDIWEQAKTEELNLPAEKTPSAQVRSNDLIHRIAHKLTTENTINIVFTAGLGIYLAITTQWAYLLFLILVMVPVILYYKDLITKINRQRYDEPVKAYLTDVYAHLRRFVIHYKILGGLLAIAGYYIGANLSGGSGLFSGLDEINGILKFLAKVILASSFAVVLIHFLYGRSVRKLKKMIEDID